MKYWAIKNMQTGTYWRAAGTSSTAPAIYMSAGKATGRRKQLRGDEWNVVEWVVTETPLPQKSH